MPRIDIYREGGAGGPNRRIVARKKRINFNKIIDRAVSIKNYNRANYCFVAG